MKLNNVLLTLATCLLFSAFTMADTTSDEHASHHPADAASTSALAPVKQKPDAQGQMPMMDMMKNMQEHMQKMQGLMQKIQTAKTPEEKKKLMQEHMDMMQSGMKMMKDMKGMGMMGDGNMMAGKMDDGKMNSGKTCNSNAMEQRMDMMEQMMDQIMQHQAAEKDAK